MEKGSECFTASLAAFQAGNFEEAAYRAWFVVAFPDRCRPANARFELLRYCKRSFNYHSEFEAHAIDWTSSTRPAPIPYQQTINADSFEGFIDAAAHLAKARAGAICGVTTTDQWKLCGFRVCAAWQAIVDPELDLALQDIRRVTAQYLLMWIQEAITRLPPNQWAINDLHLLSCGASGLWTHADLTLDMQAPWAAELRSPHSRTTSQREWAWCTSIGASMSWPCPPFLGTPQPPPPECTPCHSPLALAQK